MAQCNVGKKPPAHTAFLELCWEDKVDVVLVQEPWIGYTDGMRINTHPGYVSYIPVDFWNSKETRPRVMTYVRKGIRLKVQQQRPSQTRDLLWLKVNNITVVNLYRPPSEPHNHTT